MLTAEQLGIMNNKAVEFGIEFAALRAFCEVEAGNTIFARVNNRLVPLIRWEGHYFDRLVKSTYRALARSKGLASPKVGGIKNPRSQEARYAVLDRGKALDYDAAVMSCSWGFGQVMGEHWKLFGLNSAREFEALAMSGFEGQLMLIILFLLKKNVVKFLRLKDWAAVARIYNGSLYAKNKYDIKLAKAYAKYAGDTVVNPSGVKKSSVGMLRPGSKGPEVRELQTLLVRAGYSVTVDGDYGPATHDAVEGFQKEHGLSADGIAGPNTMSEILKFRASPTEKLAVAPVSETPEVQQVAAPFIGSVGVASLKDQMVNLSDQLSLVNTETALTIANYVQAGATVIGIGLAGYAIWGWWKSRKTVHGIEDRVPEIKEAYLRGG